MYVFRPMVIYWNSFLFTFINPDKYYYEKSNIIIKITSIIG